MKKLLCIALMAVAGVSAAVAQKSDSTQTENHVIQTESLDSFNKRVWGKGRFLRISYAIAQTGTEFDPVEKSKFAVALTKGTTYRFPKRAVGNVVKFGIDAVWLDMQFSKFNSPYSNLDWTSDFVPDNAEEDDEDGFELNIGRWGIGFGMGIGPNVSVAPFALSNNKRLQPLRASLYFHYTPTYQLYAKSQDGDTELSSAFVHMMKFGGNISYRAIAIGVEGVWGKGKFKPIDFDAMFDEEGTSMGSEKYTRKFANTRLYIQFSF